MPQRIIGQIEMNSFQQQVFGYQQVFVACINNGSIVAYSFDGGGLPVYDSFRQMVYQSKLAQAGDIRFLLLTISKHVCFYFYELAKLLFNIGRREEVVAGRRAQGAGRVAQGAWRMAQEPGW
jgi:hypothetical protein